MGSSKIEMYNVHQYANIFLFLHLLFIVMYIMLYYTEPIQFILGEEISDLFIVAMFAVTCSSWTCLFYSK